MTWQGYLLGIFLLPANIATFSSKAEYGMACYAIGLATSFIIMKGQKK